MELISLRKSVSELERCHQIRDLALDCYVTALRNAAHYAVELDHAFTLPYRHYMNALADEAAKAEPEALTESRATFRGILRDYRDRAAEYLAKLRDELAGTARALQEIMESLAQSDGDHEVQLRGALTKLRTIARSNEAAAVGDAIAGAASSIEQSLEQMRQQHQVTVSQFLTEIRVLHKRIDALETAATIDDLTKLFNRGEMETRIRSLDTGAYCVVIVRVTGLRMAAVNFSPAVSSELTGAFTKRLKNSLPEHAVISRWAEEDFVAILHMPKLEAVNAGKFIAEHLGGAYACLSNGKTVRPMLKLRIGVVDSNGEKPDRVLTRIANFVALK